MIYIVLPAYNEEKNIGIVLGKIQADFSNRNIPFCVVVVNDGSADRTSEIVKSFSSRINIQLFEFEKNRGVGEVFQTAFKFVAQNSSDPENDFCIVLDADNTQDTDCIPVMVQKILAGNDLVIASRFEPGGGMPGCPLFRQILSIGVSYLLRFYIGLPGVKDYSTFFRAYRVSLLRDGLNRYGENILEGKGFAVITGLLIKLGNISQKMTEIPTVLRYDLKHGRSGNRILKTISGYLSLLYQYTTTHRFRDLEKPLPAAETRKRLEPRPAEPVRF